MEPPAIADEDSFWHYGSFSDATLKVPAPALDRYRNADYWCLFPLMVGNGDVDGNGRTTISDVTALIDYLLGGEDGPSSLVAADMNNDNRITISDVTCLIDLLLLEGRH